MEINPKLKEYIEKTVFPSYAQNDAAHDINHIKYVINRSIKFASTVSNINFDMVYTIAAYHDIAHILDPSNHEKLSAELLEADQGLKEFFTNSEIKTMAEAIEDHRASLKGDPRSIYGKIVSSADRNTKIDDALRRTYQYRLVHTPNVPLEKMIEDSRLHLLHKFGNNGYAKEKMYFEDKEYEEYLETINNIANNPYLFRELYIKANGINELFIKYNKS